MRIVIAVSMSGPSGRSATNFGACCPHDAAEDVVLEDDDLTRFGIDANRLAGQIGAGGGLAGPVSAVVDGVWMIGSGPAGRVLMLCDTADRLEGRGQSSR